MNVHTDPVGFKALSKQFAAVAAADAGVLDESKSQSISLNHIRWAMLGIFTILFIALMHLSALVSMPLAAGVVAGLIIAPIADRADEWGVPSVIVVAILLVLVLLTPVLIGYLLMPSLSDLIALGPKINARIATLKSFIQPVLDMLDTAKREAADGAVAVKTETAPSSLTMAGSFLSSLAPALSQLVIFIFTILLFIAYRNNIRLGFARMFVDREQRLGALRSFLLAQDRLTSYLAMITLINLSLGILVGVVFYLLGVPGAPAIALLVFMLNYMPVIGPLIMKATLLITGFIAYTDVWLALMPAALYLIVSMIEANCVTPKLVSNRIIVNPFLIFAGVVILTWIWGFGGAFLAMPLLAIASVAIETFGPRPGPKLPQ